MAGVLEVATVTAREGEDDALATAYAEAIAVVRRHPGARRASVLRQIEDPRVFTLLIEWDSIQAHLDFGASALMPQFRAALGGRVEQGSAAHYVTILEET